jgi:hypothetical protein
MVAAAPPLLVAAEAADAPPAAPAVDDCAITDIEAVVGDIDT